MTGKRGVGVKERAREDVLEDVEWLRENGYRHATNRQLAERLGMTLKALENHLTRARRDGDRRADFGDRRVAA